MILLEVRRALLSYQDHHTVLPTPAGLAWKAIMQDTNTTAPEQSKVWGKANLTEYRKLGYLPSDVKGQGHVSSTLDYGFAVRPAAQSASRSLRRALLTPWVNAGSLYRCSRST